MTTRFDRLALLATFVRIAERGSLSAAARDLDTSQPSVSRQLAALEGMLGTSLVSRTTHSLALTADGTALLGDARRLLGEWEGLTERLTGDADLRGTLRVVAPVALGQRHFMRAALAFAREHPGVTIEWRLTDRPIRFAEEGCDLWIKVGPIPDDTLVVREIARVERLVVATPDLALRHGSEALERWPWVTLGPFEGSRIALNGKNGSEVSFVVVPRLATDNILALLEAVRNGLGAAIMPRWFVQKELDTGALIDAAPDLRAARLPINLALATGARRPMRVERFAEAVASWASETL
jgi:DNA-binding transcriptional LysR family regulator